MHFERQKAKILFHHTLFWLFLYFLQSCTIVKHFPQHKPFVFNNQISLSGKTSKEEKKRLLIDLENYWADSLKARKIQQFGFIYKLKHPQLFDSVKLAESKTMMNAYLNAQGFYYATLQPIARIDTFKPNGLRYLLHFKKSDSSALQYRTTVQMKINLGKTIIIDSVHLSFQDTNLHKLAINQQQYSYLKKGITYNKQLISNELDRLVNIFHQNGYYRLQREDFYALIDTLDKSMLTVTTDPLKQLALLQEAEKKAQKNPKWNISVLQRSFNDSTKNTQYSIGKTYYYPEFNGLLSADSLLKSHFSKTFIHKEMVMKYNEGKFHYKPIREHTYLRNKQLYNEENLYKTINTLGRMGPWSNVDYLLKVRDKDTIDIHFLMTPGLKQSYTASLEGSRNTGDIGSGNLLGLAVNVGYNNRNNWKRAIQSATNARLGTELNLDQQQSNANYNFVQTIQGSLGHSYNIPRLIHPFYKWQFLNRQINKLDNKRTVIATTAAYTDRRNFYKLGSWVTSWSYEFSTKNNHAFAIKPLNIELYRVDTLDGLINLFNENPFLRNSFRNGNVTGSSLNWSKTFQSNRNSNTSHLIRFGAEESGLLLGWIYSKAMNKTFDYLKLEAEYRLVKKYKNDELAGRFFTGIGLTKNNQTLPVFKQYFLGGPNSMRAWGLRQLGLGSSRYSDTATSGYTDRFGDFVLETNLEYRFHLATFSAVKIGSAVYTDIGNIWNIHHDPYNSKSKFEIGNFYKDIAIGVGTGLRLDFSYFLFRLDFAYKVKDPARTNNNGWMSLDKFEWMSTRENGIRVKNFAFQFGIGLPF